MSKGRRLRDARAGDVTWVDAYDAFARILSEMMAEYGLVRPNVSKSDMDETIRLCCETFRATWDEYVLDLLYGDDARARTMAVLRASIDVQAGRIGGGMMLI